MGVLVAILSAAEDLKEIINNVGLTDDYMSAVRNKFVYIEGYVLGYYALNPFPEDSENISRSIEAWCEFIENDVVV